jgi:hypothetical protein
MAIFHINIPIELGRGAYSYIHDLTDKLTHKQIISKALCWAEHENMNPPVPTNENTGGNSDRSYCSTKAPGYTNDMG